MTSENIHTKMKGYMVRGGVGVLVAFAGMLPAMGQVAVKNNLIYDATSTPNAGVEVGVGRRSTVNLVYGMNPWEFSSQTRGKRFAKHWVLVPEYRYWLCSRFSGHFVGVHALGGEMNVANANLPVPGGFFGGADLKHAVRDGRYEGGFAGFGLTYGYQWPMSRHFNIEAGIGVGYVYVWYDKYRCATCGKRQDKGHTNYLGATKTALSLIYIF